MEDSIDLITNAEIKDLLDQVLTKMDEILEKIANISTPGTDYEVSEYD